MKRLKGLSDVRTSQRAGARSIPGRQRSAYLDLYVLEKERRRLEEENAALAQRMETNGKRSRDIERRIESLLAPGLPPRANGAGRELPPPQRPRWGKRVWKKMCLPY